jgi:starch synthase
MQPPSSFLRSRGRTGKRRPRVLLCTPEVTELPAGMGNAANHVSAKGGGLGDISAGLIRHLYSDRRFELHVALPRYDTRIRDLAKITNRELDLLVPLMHGKGIHLVNDSAFAHSPEVYAESEAHPRTSRALAFQRHVINQLLDELQPDIVHCNDWMTALIPAAARDKGIRSVFTLHNVFTELESPDSIDRAGIDVSRFMEHLYFERFPEPATDNWSDNRVDFTASAIHAADAVNTVSPTFLDEVVRGEFPGIVPPSVRSAIRAKHAVGAAHGILNAPRDPVAPRLSRYIRNYGLRDVSRIKPLNKADFQERMGLHQDPVAPLFLWPSRLYAQKGPELLLAELAALVAGSGIQLAVVAAGDAAMEHAFRRMEARFSGRVAFRTFREDLSELGKAGSDFILMPSRYEPCGLPQMEGMRFGTLPVVRLTGGLRDTVEEVDAEAGEGNGFAFEQYSSAALRGAMERAVAFHRLPERLRRQNVKRIMRQGHERFSLARTAEQYIDLYESLLGDEWELPPRRPGARTRSR